MSHSFIRQSTTPSANHSNESVRLASSSTANNASLDISESDAYNHASNSNNSYPNVSTSSASIRQQMNSAEFMEYLDTF